jgi:hypothetical protein
LKRFGADEETWDARRLKEQADRELFELGKAEDDKKQKAKAKRLRSDISTLQRRIDAIVRLAESIGGMITDGEAKALILQKHHDLVAEQLNRYLSAERQALALVFEHLWDKYSRSEQQLITSWRDSELKLSSFLTQLQFLAK